MYTDFTAKCQINIFRILGGCLLISSLPDKALRTNVSRAIQHAFSKPCLINLISKDTNLVFYLSIGSLLKLAIMKYNFINFHVDSMSLMMSSKSAM